MHVCTCFMNLTWTYFLFSSKIKWNEGWPKTFAQQCSEWQWIVWNNEITPAAYRVCLLSDIKFTVYKMGVFIFANNLSSSSCVLSVLHFLHFWVTWSHINILFSSFSFCALLTGCNSTLKHCIYVGYDLEKVLLWLQVYWHLHVWTHLKVLNFIFWTNIINKSMF